MDKNLSGSLIQVEKERILPAAITDTGCERDINEDRYAYIETHSGELWLVCDGMGGVSGGELAAQLAIDAIRREMDQEVEDSVAKSLENAIIEANRVIVLRRQNKMFAQMGTTVVSALISQSKVCISHVGDSRAYLIRDKQIEQITNDHTFVQELVDNNKITYEESLNHPQSHVLTKAIGSQLVLEPSTQELYVWNAEGNKNADMLVLCSDGLYSHVSDDELCKYVAEMSPQRACADLVELAKSRGGFDNITVCIIPIKGQLRREPFVSDKLSTRKNGVFDSLFVEETNWSTFLMEVSIGIFVTLVFFMISILIVGYQIRS